jgi:hypothetical protein
MSQCAWVLCKPLRCVSIIALLAGMSACGDDDSASNPSQEAGRDASVQVAAEPGRADAGPVTACAPDESAPVPEDRCAANSGGDSPECEKWLKVEPEGAVCSDGSQYKFFVNYTKRSNNLVVMFEPGGACWDYASCSGGARGAANPHGIPDDHMDKYQYLNLLLRTDDNPMKDWNMVFVSYCTGDVHFGDKVATYTDPAGGPPLVFHHEGHKNSTKVIEFLKAKFSTVPKLMVTGCSAGGIGALDNYALIRRALTGAQCGYMLDDSGPAFHSNGPSMQLHTKIRSAWNLDPVLETLAEGLPVTAAQLEKDYGLLNTALADKYPSDRLSLVLYRMDFNYSLYSYETSFPGSTEADIHAKWWQDVQGLIKTYDTRPNLAYYIPYFRADNCSHCVSIPPLDHDTSTILSMPWLGSEIEQDHLNLKDFVKTLIDDGQPLESYLEDVQASEMFTSEQSMMCLKPK